MWQFGWDVYLVYPIVVEDVLRGQYLPFYFYFTNQHFSDVRLTYLSLDRKRLYKFKHLASNITWWVGSLQGSYTEIYLLYSFCLKKKKKILMEELWNCRVNRLGQQIYIIIIDNEKKTEKRKTTPIICLGGAGHDIME